MKLVCLFLTVLMNFQVFAAEDLRAVQKKHRALEHEASKEWYKMKKDCEAKYPNRFKKDHPDYDADFKCNEAINDEKDKFNAKLKAELCEKFQVSCIEKD